MKFDYIIGNPPYQEEKEDNGRKPPIYHLFLDECYKLGEITELITPARFLFDAGQTPKAWNKKMLNDEHLKVKYYEPKSSKVFVNTDIKGGVAITYRDLNTNFGPIEAFTSFNDLNNILRKVREFHKNNFQGLDLIVSNRGLYRLSDKFYEDFPNAKDKVGTGTGNMIVSNIFEKIPEAFNPKKDENEEIVKLLGRLHNKRIYKEIYKKYIIDNEYLNSFNVLVPEANGSGAIGEVLSTPLIGDTDTFLSIGKFNSKTEAENCLTYIKTKFSRTMLGIKKATQHNPKSTWIFVPMQDFTETSDIDWTQSISDVDKQLYKKYGLSEEEINFIETHVKEME